MKKENQEIRIFKLERMLISLFLLMIIIFGAMLNFTVMFFNGGKIPVHYKYFYNDEQHFSFNNYEEINKPYLSDIFHISGWIFSIGDIIMLFFSMLLVINTTYFFYKLRKIKKEVKNGGEKK